MRTKTPAPTETILTVAARLFATHRFHEARMEDIAAAAGVGKGTLYRYFKDKDELYLALLARAAQQISRRLGNVEDGEKAPRARLEAMVGELLTYFDEQPHLFDLIQHAEVVGALDRENPWNEARTETFARFEAVFVQGTQTGQFSFDDPELAVLMLLGGMRAVIRFGKRPRPVNLAGQIVDHFLLGHAGGLPCRVNKKASAN